VSIYRYIFPCTGEAKCWAGQIESRVVPDAGAAAVSNATDVCRLMFCLFLTDELYELSVSYKFGTALETFDESLDR